MPFHITAGELAKLINAEVNGDAAAVVTDLNGIEHAQAGELSFYASARYAKFLAGTKASVLMMVKGTPEIADIRQRGVTVLEVADPFQSYMQLCHWIIKQQAVKVAPGVHPTAIIAAGVKVPASAMVGPYVVIESDVVIGEKVRIDAFAYIGPLTRIGEGSRIRAYVAIVSPCTIGKNCDIQAGVVLGADGLAINKGAGADGPLSRIPQLGDVQIEDNCQLGAQTIVERAALGHTRIGHDTKIDVSAVIGHGDQIGAQVRICALCGLAGSITVGDNVVMGGHCGLADHTTIGANAILAGGTFIGGDVKGDRVYIGHPGKTNNEWLREQHHMKKMHESHKEVKALRKQLDELQQRLAELEARA